MCTRVCVCDSGSVSVVTTGCVLLFFGGSRKLPDHGTAAGIDPLVTMYIMMRHCWFLLLVSVRAVLTCKLVESCCHQVGGSGIEIHQGWGLCATVFGFMS